MRGLLFNAYDVTSDQRKKRHRLKVNVEITRQQALEVFNAKDTRAAIVSLLTKLCMEEMEKQDAPEPPKV